MVDIPEGITLVGVSPMRQRKVYPESFKKDAVRRLLARGSRTVPELAKELESAKEFSPQHFRQTGFVRASQPRAYLLQLRWGGRVSG